jgi:cob(I)alamin adenosyltransferase
VSKPIAKIGNAPKIYAPSFFLFIFVFLKGLFRNSYFLFTLPLISVQRPACKVGQAEEKVDYERGQLNTIKLMSSKIYTKTGDAGKTSLIGGTKVPKSHLRIEAYGTVDELNSYIGLLNDHLKTTAFEPTKNILKEIQDRLFTIGSSLACDPDKEPLMKIPDLKEEDVLLLEKEIDAMNEKLPTMKSFILPGGDVAVSTAHINRCVCRRAERICVNMQEHDLFVDPLVIKYLNRLSDYLFVVARYIALLLNVAEMPWKARVNN